jgi:hypothetical protein
VSHKKDKRRVAVGEIFRDGKVTKLTKCPVPNCPRGVTTGESAHGLCPKHEEDLAFLLFILPHIRMEKAETPSGLVLPGQPGFQAVPEAVIKEEIQKHGRLKP